MEPDVSIGFGPKVTRSSSLERQLAVMQQAPLCEMEGLRAVGPGCVPVAYSRSTDQQYQDGLALPTGSVRRRLRSELPYCAPPKAALFDLVCGENETLRFCCELW
jgi:hypothetical protein